MEPRSILITGANGGLGCAMGTHFLTESPGNFLWLAVRNQREKAQQLQGQHTDRCQLVDLDVSNPEQWKV